MKPKIHVVSPAEFWTWSIGAPDGSVLNAGPGTVTSALGTGVPTSRGEAAGASVGVVCWLTGAGGTKIGRRVAGACVGAVVGLGVGLGVRLGVG